MLCSKILVAYNESELAKKSLEVAIEMANTDPSIEIDVLNVFEPPHAPYIIGSAYDDVVESMQAHADKLLSEAKERLATIKNPSRTFIVEGSALHAILDHVKEHHSDLVIMGSRGLGGVREFLGSVSHYVVQHSTVPVLIIK